MKEFSFNTHGIAVRAYLVEDWEDLYEFAQLIKDVEVVAVDTETEGAASYFATRAVEKVKVPTTRSLDCRPVYSKVASKYQIGESLQTHTGYKESYNATTDTVVRRKINLAQAHKVYSDRDKLKLKRYELIKKEILHEVSTNPLHRQDGLRHRRNMLQLLQLGFEAKGGSIYHCALIQLRVVNYEALGALLEGKKIIMHSASFDCRMIEHHLGLELDTRQIWDTKIAERVLRNGKDLPGSYSMAGIVKRRYEVEIDKDKSVRVGHWGGHLSERQLEYAAYDIVWPLKIYRDQLNEADENDLKIIQFESELISKTVAMELNGISVDMEKIDKLIEDSPKEVAQKAEKVFKLIKVTDKPLKYLNSPKSLLEALHSIGYQDLESTRDPVLETYANKCPAFREVYEAISEYRTTYKLVRTYLKPYKQQAVRLWDGSYRLYFNMNQMDTETGRYSSSNPNLQAAPKTQEFRSIFVARKGFKLIQADYSSIEPRIFAEFTKDPFLVNAFLYNKDVYKLLGSVLTRVKYEDVDKEQRNKLKSVVLAMMYGRTAFGLAYSLNVHFTEAMRLVKDVKNEMVKASKYMLELIKKAEEKGYAETCRGRKRYLLDINSSDKYKKKPSDNQALNTPYQGSAAEIMKEAMVKWPYRKELMVVVHDEVWLEVKETLTYDRAPLLKRVMESAGRVFIKTVPVLIGEAPEHAPNVVNNLGEAM